MGRGKGLTGIQIKRQRNSYDFIRCTYFSLSLRGVMDAVASFEMVIKPQERLYLNIVSYDSLTT